jgi:putative DNA primase/helicase
MTDIRKPFHEAVAQRLIEQLRQGTAPWQKPWQPGEPLALLPMNPITGKRYKGINAIQLMSQGRTDQRWMTYRQAAGAGGQVREGEKGTPIQYWKFSEEQIETGANGRPVFDAKGGPVKHLMLLERPRVFFASVFNAEQINGLPPIERKTQDWNAIERAEKILEVSGAAIHHDQQNRAFYRPATDSIHLPHQAQFPTADNYYATTLHELGYWTGHGSQLNRDLLHPFGSEGYAKEELRAEIASMILGDELGIGHDPAQHAAYVGVWIKLLQSDPLEVFRAAADAEKIQTYVLGFEQVQTQTAQQNHPTDDATRGERLALKGVSQQRAPDEHSAKT